jgi:hypothetical protein
MRVRLDTPFALRAPNSGAAVYLERLAGALAEPDGMDVVWGAVPQLTARQSGHGDRLQVGSVQRQGSPQRGPSQPRLVAAEVVGPEPEPGLRVVWLEPGGLH